MLDNAGIKMAQGEKISCEQIDGVNDNMSEPHFHDFFWTILFGKRWKISNGSKWTYYYETGLTPSEYRKNYLYKKKNTLA